MEGTKCWDCLNGVGGRSNLGLVAAPGPESHHVGALGQLPPSLPQQPSPIYRSAGPSWAGAFGSQVASGAGENQRGALSGRRSPSDPPGSEHQPRPHWAPPHRCSLTLKKARWPQQQIYSHVKNLVFLLIFFSYVSIYLLYTS